MNKARVRYKNGDLTYSKLKKLIPESVSFKNKDGVEKSINLENNDALKKSWKRILRPEKSYRDQKQFGAPSHLCVDQKNSQVLPEKNNSPTLPILGNNTPSYDDLIRSADSSVNWAGVETSSGIDDDRKINQELNMSSRSKCPECRCYANTQVDVCCNVENSIYGAPCWGAGLDHIMCADSIKKNENVFPTCKRYTISDVNKRCDSANNYIDSNFWMEKFKETTRQSEKDTAIEVVTTRFLRELDQFDWTSIISKENIENNADITTIVNNDEKTKKVYNFIVENKESVKTLFNYPNDISYLNFFDFFNSTKLLVKTKTSDHYQEFNKRCVNIPVPYQEGTTSSPNIVLSELDKQLNTLSTDEYNNDNIIYLTEEEVNTNITKDRDSKIACRGLSDSSYK